MCPAGTRRGSDLHQATHPSSFRSIDYCGFYLCRAAYDNQLRLADDMNPPGTVWKNPFRRPWMSEHGAAAAAGGGQGLKGIIAGEADYERTKNTATCRNPCHCTFCPASVPSGGRGHWDTRPLQSKQVIDVHFCRCTLHIL